MTLAFKDRFVDLVIAGTKLHTIREDRHARWHVGRAIQFYKNTRTPLTKKFRADGVALAVQQLELVDKQAKKQPGILVDGRQLTPLECQELSRRDGFEDFAQLLAFFRETHGLPFTGKLIGWTDLRY